MALVPSPNAYALLRQLEGFRTQAYPDSGGIWTIGYGSTRWLDNSAIRAGQTCTLQQAEQLLEIKVQEFMTEVSKYIHVVLNQNQIDAIAIFVYNVGASAFESSTLLKYLNQQNYDEAANQFVWQDAAGYHGWVHVNGVVNQGLVKRRQVEQNLFKTPVTITQPDFSNVISGVSTVNG